MQIVINISEKDYEYYKDDSNFYGYSKARQIILDGAPLPKGHGDLIDVNGLKASMSCYMSDSANSYTAKYVMSVAKGLVDFQKPIVKADNEEE